MQEEDRGSDWPSPSPSQWHGLVESLIDSTSFLNICVVPKPGCIRMFDDLQRFHLGEVRLWLVCKHGWQWGIAGQPCDQISKLQVTLSHVHEHGVNPLTAAVVSAETYAEQGRR